MGGGRLLDIPCRLQAGSSVTAVVSQRQGYMPYVIIPRIRHLFLRICIPICYYSHV